MGAPHCSTLSPKPESEALLLPTSPTKFLRFSQHLCSPPPAPVLVSPKRDSALRQGWRSRSRIEGRG
eukprot:2277058-Rhodomonas_salina.1